MKYFRKYLLLVACLVAGYSAFAAFVSQKPKKQTDEKLHLIHADRLSHDEFMHPGAQILKGKVYFRQGVMELTCDSAVYYEDQSLFEAFGKVFMKQTDTLTLRGDYLEYDGLNQTARVRRNVVMTHRKQVLTTDSLDYDRLYNTGYFFEGGKLVDGDNTLTSDWGRYSTADRQAAFYYSVKLKNKKFTLTSDTLHYDVATKWAHVLGPSNVISGASHIYTEDGFYNTTTQRARLMGRPVLFNQGRKLQGDSLYYDKPTGMMKAFRNIYYEDSNNKHILTGDYGQYNELTGEAMATGRALARDFSGGRDTLYVHADTLRLFSYHLKTDSAYRMMHGYFHVRAYRTDVQAVCDSLVANSQTKRMTLYRDPIVWSGARQVLGEEINVFSNDSTLDSIHVDRQAIVIERVDSVHFNQVAGHAMRTYFHKGEIFENRVMGNVRVVNYPQEKDSLILYQNYLETATLRMFLKEKKVQKILAPTSASGCFYGVGLAPKDRTFLENFAWFDYIRPLHKDDLFEWRPKKSGTELKASVRREAPLQTLKKTAGETPAPASSN